VPYQDPAPGRISLADWCDRFQEVPDELIRRYRYFGSPEPWATYLFPPVSFAVYGSRHLVRLRFDNSLAALRVWGFVLSETERLFRARQIGRRVIATMGDLGGTPPLVLAFGDTVPFYPDCIWWTPFLNESNVLFEAAAARGVGESACYSRAALGAFVKRSYFPDPVLCIAATGASCDDYSAVEQLVAALGCPMLWFELPLRRDPALERSPVRTFAARPRGHQEGTERNGFSTTETRRHEAGACRATDSPEPRPGPGYRATPTGTEYQESARELLVAQFHSLRAGLSDLLGQSLRDDAIRASIDRVNRVRRLVGEIKDLVHSAPAPVLPALEMMVLEFGNLHFYSDIAEWTAILEHVRDTVRDRLARRQYTGPADALRVVWVTPPADPLLLVHAEDIGLRIVGTEYVINQALPEIRVNGDPAAGLAEALLDASLIGSSRARAQSVIDQARRHRAEGVVISGILGGSHCALETGLIRDYVQEALDLPVLGFDVPAPAAAVSGQIRTRLEAFVELLRGRRSRR
jgi:hypothetical protein